MKSIKECSPSDTMTRAEVMHMRQIHTAGTWTLGNHYKKGGDNYNISMTSGEVSGINGDYFQAFSGAMMAALNRTAKGEVSVKEAPDGVVVNQEYFDWGKMKKFGPLVAMFFALLTTKELTILSSGFSQVKPLTIDHTWRPPVITTSTTFPESQIHWTFANNLKADVTIKDIGSYKV